MQHENGASPFYDGPTRSNALPSRRLSAALEHAGFGFHEVLAFSPTWSRALLSRFNVVVLGAGGTGNQQALQSDTSRAAIEELLEYVKAGGGLLVLRNPGYQFGRDIEEVNEWLGPLGAEILDEQVVDEAHATLLPSRATLFRTERLAAHPITEGLQAVWYPDALGSYRRYTNFSSPLEVSSDWSVVVRGAETARTVRRSAKASQPPTLAPAGHGPPLLAARQLGRGRLVVCSIASSTLWQDSDHPLWGGGGDTSAAADRGADPVRLVTNTLTWLAEPTRDTSGDRSPEPRVPPSKPSAAPPTRSNLRVHRGVIGARTTLSGGRATPQQFIQAARDRGLEFIAFAEHLESLTPAKLATLNEVCAAGTDRGFAAYPGFRYFDASGNQWITFAKMQRWPDARWMVPGQAGIVRSNNPLARTWAWPPIVLVHPGKNPEPAWLQGNFNAIAVHTYAAGRLVDDATETYLRLMAASFTLSPVTVHLLNSPQHIPKPGQNSYLTHFRSAELDAPAALGGRGTRRFGSRPGAPAAFVSQGPVIEQSRVRRSHGPLLSAKEQKSSAFIFAVSSEQGLAEVNVLDPPGTTWRRRFAGHGAKRLHGTVPFHHDRQRNLLLEVRDRRGRRALGWTSRTVSRVSSFLRSSDNLNTLLRGVWWHPPRGHANARGIESHLFSRTPSYLGNPLVTGVDEMKRPAVAFLPQVASAFAVVVDAIQDHHYPPSTPATLDQTDVPQRAEPNRLLVGQVRHTLFTPRPDGSVLTLVEGDFSAGRDLPAGRVTLHTGWRTGAHGLWASATDGLVQSRIDQARPAVSGVVPNGGFVALTSDAVAGSAGVISLEDDLQYAARVSVDGTRGTLLLFPAAEHQSARRDRIRYRFISVASGPGGLTGQPRFAQAIVHALGVQGTTAYSVTPGQGSVVDRRFVLTVRADAYAFAGTVTEAALPIDLPVRVLGLNPRWDAGVLYRGMSVRVVSDLDTDEYGRRIGVRRRHEARDVLLRIPVLEDGVGLAQIDTEVGDKDIFVGNLLVSDVPAIALTLLHAGPERAVFEAHNPARHPVQCRVWPHPRFALLAPFVVEATVPGGRSVEVQVGYDEGGNRITNVVTTPAGAGSVGARLLAAVPPQSG